MPKLYDLFGLENGARFRSRGWIGFQLIAFSVFVGLEGVLFVLAVADEDAKKATYFGAATVMFGLLLGVSVHQWRKYGHATPG